MSPLSARLQAALDFLIDSHVLADVGCDHGYLPIAAIQNQKVSKAIASDNKVGPLEKARDNILKAGLQNQIETILCDGLRLLPNNVDTVAILGMGGEQIAKILNDGPLNTIKTLILGPNSEAGVLRKWLASHGYTIVDERFIEDRKHLYQIIKATPGMMTLDAQEATFGPLNILKQDPLMLKYVDFELHKLTEAYQKTTSLAKKAEIQTKIDELRGVRR